MLKCLTVAAGMLVFLSTVRAEERFHPIENLCIEYEVSGQLMNGTMIQCHRKYGFESFTIQDTEVGIGNIKQKQMSHTITIGDKIYAVDTATQTATVTTNPMYQHLVQRMSQSGESAEDIGRTFISAMQYSPDGSQKTIQNMECSGYRSPSIGYACFSEDFIVLEQEVFGNRQVATRVQIGESGGDENYTLWQRVELRQGVDLSNGINVQEILKNYQQQ